MDGARLAKTVVANKYTLSSKGTKTFHVLLLSIHLDASTLLHTSTLPILVTQHSSSSANLVTYLTSRASSSRSGSSVYAQST